MNLTGTYGMGSAQFWWGRLMPQIQRIALHMGLVQWILLYVDDMLALFKFLCDEQLGEQAAELLAY